MRHEASSDSGKTNYSMQFWPIEVQLVLNRHAGFNLMQWLGLQARLTLTVTCTLRNCLFLTRAFIMICMYFMHSWDWMLAEIRYCQFIICHELQAFKICGGRSLPVTY